MYPVLQNFVKFLIKIKNRIVVSHFGRGGAEGGKLVSTAVFHVSIKMVN